MAETPDDTLLGALARAKDLIKRNRDWDLLRALAEATTTTQCAMPGYKVFRDVRAAIGDHIPIPLHDFSDTSTRSMQLDAIDKTIHALRGN